VTKSPDPSKCRWCGRPIPARAGPGRPRRYCRQTCRQRDWEARQRAAEAGLSERELIVTRTELDALRDQLYVLEAAVADVDRDLAEADDDTAVREALAWLLEAARPLVGIRLAESGSDRP
jgi:hypothetical protein